MVMSNQQKKTFSQLAVFSVMTILGLVLVPCSMVFADTASVSEIKSAINVYFEGEKTGSLLKIAAAVATAIVGVFMFRKSQLGKGLGCLLLLVAVIELFVGGTVYLRADAQLVGLLEQLQLDRAVFQQEETVRMAAVLSGFEVFRMIQFGMIVVGALLFIIAKLKERPTIQGVGIGLFIMGPILLIMDLMGTWRAELYFEALQKLGG